MRRTIGLILAILLSSCALYQTRQDKLQEAVFHFYEGVRWGRLEDVLSRIHPDAKEHFLEMHREFGREIQVTNCEVVNSKVDLDNKKAEVGIKITWYRTGEMVVRDTILLQHWEEIKAHWFMVAEEYRSGTPF